MRDWVGIGSLCLSIDGCFLETYGSKECLIVSMTLKPKKGSHGKIYDRKGGGESRILIRTRFPLKIECSSRLRSYIKIDLHANANLAF